jgi:hypothetical protein
VWSCDAALAPPQGPSPALRIPAQPVIPPRVDYSLTPLGHAAASQVWTLTRWVENNLDEVTQAREAYDEARAQPEPQPVSPGR